jgi:glycosyltransferase involved in cell wall biosynthesis
MKKIMVILAGPTYDPDASLRARFEILSEKYHGVVVTTGSQLDSKRYRNFDAFFSYFSNDRKLVSIYRQFALCLSVLLRARRAGQPYDLIVCYDPLKTGLMARVLSKLMRTSLVVEVNGVYQSPSEYVDLSKAQAFLKRFFYTQVENLVLKGANGIKLLFPDQLNGLSFDRSNKTILSYFNYVDMERFSPAESKKFVLFVGFPFFRKGVDLLVEAYSALAIKYPDWELKIIGWFNEEEMALVRRAQEQCSQIVYHPPVKHSEMPEYMSQSAFLVLPSRSEAMGRVLIEAMACAKPRLGSRVDGIPEYISDGDDGLLFDCGDARDLQAKLDQLMASDELRQRLGGNAYQRYRTDFSKEKFLSLTAQLYDAAIAAVPARK